MESIKEREMTTTELKGYMDCVAQELRHPLIEMGVIGELEASVFLNSNYFDARADLVYDKDSRKIGYAISIYLNNNVYPLSDSYGLDASRIVIKTSRGRVKIYKSIESVESAITSLDLGGFLVCLG